MEPDSIVKRDGSRQRFNRERITAAIARAQAAVGMCDPELLEELGQVVVEYLARTAESDTIGIEAVQDAVIYVLQESGNYELATAYIRYRDARERERRRRNLSQSSAERPNLTVVGSDTRERQWRREQMRDLIMAHRSLGEKAADDVLLAVEEFLADTDVTEISHHLLMGLVDAAMVRSGRAATAERSGDLRISCSDLREAVGGAGDGRDAVMAAGAHVLAQLALHEDYPVEVRRQFCRGRLWVDGLADPRRGYEFTATLDGHPDSWQVLSQAFALATAAGRSWRNVNLIIPPMILGHLERGGEALIEPLEELSSLAHCYLYCDGRTPLLDDWPFRSKRISIASYAEDFLLLGRLQEMGLEHLSGPHLMQGGYRRRIAGLFALNAQGFEEEYSQMDLLAMALVSAARVRQRQLSADSELAGAGIRYAIYGLPPTSPSNEYLERQVVQEGLRSGIALQRTSHLTGEACEHLGRLFD
ncbi:MAG: ATP cone domain-containing protein [Planctomycetota bacterium]